MNAYVHSGGIFMSSVFCSGRSPPSIGNPAAVIGIVIPLHDKVLAAALAFPKMDVLLQHFREFHLENIGNRRKAVLDIYEAWDLNSCEQFIQGNSKLVGQSNSILRWIQWSSKTFQEVCGRHTIRHHRIAHLPYRKGQNFLSQAVWRQAV